MNGKIIDYQIFYKPSEFLLMSQVKEALKDGWEPYGPPFFDGNGDVAQAMVKRGLSIESSIRQSLLAEIAERGPKDIEITDDGMMPPWANIKATGFNEANTEWRKLLKKLSEEK